MNHRTTKTRFPCNATPRGITVIEVLTSIVVAMIGVFGVMILIPFAVQQAQLGLDRDEASVIGRNAFAQYEIEGFRFVDDNGTTRWRAAAGPVVLNRAVTPNAAQIYAIDPLGLTESGVTIPVAGTNVFPDVDIPPPAGPPSEPVVEFDQINLLDLNGVEYSQAMARKMFRTRDDLVFGEPLDELGPPQQYFDTNGMGANLRRQARGQMSWNAIAIPVKEDYTSATPTTWGWKFQLHVLVHKDRDFDTANVRYECRPLDTTVNTGMAYSGGTVTLAANQTFTDVRKDDWVMLVNRDLNGEPGFDTQVGFYRVIGIADIGGVTTLTLDGPDFQFGNPGTTHSQAFAVHLVGLDNLDDRRRGHVVNVYERTMRWERKSNWN